MEKKKNIIFITGIDSYGVRKEKERWKYAFRERQWGENIEEVRIEEVKDWSRIEQDMQSMGLFATKRLWCFSGWFEKKKKEEWETTKKKKGEGIEEQIISLCELAGEDHFMIFSNLLFDAKKWALITWLREHADVRNFEQIWTLETWEKRFSELDTKIIKKVLDAYREAESGKEETNASISDAIGWTLEKLSLLQEARTLTEKDIDESLDRAFSGKMFDLSDALLAKNVEKSRLLLSRILENMTPYELLPTLIGLLRWALYVKYLANLGKKEREIGNIIQIHPYVLQKTLSAKISYAEIAKLYENLVNANIAYKSGRWMKDGELWRIFAIERAIMGLKKI